ncbi:hypothetical protein AQJ43_35900 [Streptomyces avermitilis]|nr:hypothetical protein AQJ43_35900 [Streptomyces avermitilis]
MTDLLSPALAAAPLGRKAPARPGSDYGAGALLMVRILRSSCAMKSALRTQYDAPVISHRAGSPGQLLVIACTVVALVTAPLSWYAAHTVRPDCVVAISKVTDGNGHHLPDVNGRVWSDNELADRAYQQAVDSGRCDPPHARWRQWLD